MCTIPWRGDFAEEARASGYHGIMLYAQGYKGKSIPYMLLWHGAGWTGSDMINIFKSDAIRAG